MPRLPEKNKEYMRSYYKDPKRRALKKKRDRDRYNWEKENGPIKKGMELDHGGGYGRGKKKVITRTANRRKGARTTNRVRKKVN